MKSPPSAILGVVVLIATAFLGVSVASDDTAIPRARLIAKQVLSGSGGADLLPGTEPGTFTVVTSGGVYRWSNLAGAVQRITDQLRVPPEWHPRPVMTGGTSRALIFVNLQGNGQVLWDSQAVAIDRFQSPGTLVYASAATSDGALLLVATPDKLCVMERDANGYKGIASVKHRVPRAVGLAINDSDSLVALGGYDGTVLVWRLETLLAGTSQSESARFDLRLPVRSLQFTESKSAIVAVCDAGLTGEVVVLISTNQDAGSLPVAIDAVSSTDVSFVPRRPAFVSVKRALSNQSDDLALFDLETGETSIIARQLPRDCRQIVVDASGTYCAVLSEGGTLAVYGLELPAERSGGSK